MLDDDLAARRGFSPHRVKGMIGAREAERMLGVSRAVLHKLAQDGRLRATLIDRPGVRRQRLFNRDDVDRVKRDGTALKSAPRLRHIRRAWVRLFGPIPYGFTVIARDGQDRNTEPSNLALAPLSSRVRTAHHYKRKRRTHRGTRTFWSLKARRYLRQHYATSSAEDIAAHLGVTPIAVRARASQMRLRKSIEFLSQRARRSRAQPIGTERYDKFNDRILVKVSDTGVQYKRWRPKHHVEWEKANGKKVPDGFRVIFKDGNKHNFDPRNLQLTTLEAVSANAFAKFLSYPPPLRGAIRLTKKLEREIARKKSDRPDAGPTRGKARARPRPGRRWTPAMEARVRKEFPIRTTVELAKSLGVSRVALIARARKLGVYRSPDAMVRLANKKAKAAIAQAFGEG